MKLFNHKALILGLPLSFLLLTASCKKEKSPEPEEETPAPSGPSYNVPTTYNFTNVNFSGSTTRIAMLGEMLTYIRTTHTTTLTPGATLSGQKLKDMYVNANNQFTDPALNASGFQLKDKTSTAFNLQNDLEAYFTEAETTSIYAATSPTTITASNGVAGKLISGTKAYLVDANGFEYKELTEKGVMGGVLYYQAMTILANIGTYDNTTLVGGTTAQEKAWDEAFGYFGVPVDFPTNLTGLKNWGSYCNSVNASIGSNATIMNAWLKGRAAITNKDNTRRDEARNTVAATWEKVGAARFITYVKAAKAGIADDATRNHSLSEGVGFIKAFKYSPLKSISDAQINQLLGYIGNNLYTVSTTNLDNAINTMATIFNLDPATL